MNMFLLNDHYKKVQEAEVQITKDILAMSFSHQLILHDLLHRIKSKRSFRRKVKTIMVRDHIPQSYAMSRIHDLIRYTIIVPDENIKTVEKTKEIITDSLKCSHYNLTEEKNYFFHPKKTGYKAYHMYFLSPSGFVFEIQIHTKKSYHHKKRTHRSYKNKTTLKKRKD